MLLKSGLHFRSPRPFGLHNGKLLNATNTDYTICSVVITNAITFIIVFIFNIIERAIFHTTSVAIGLGASNVTACPG